MGNNSRMKVKSTGPLLSLLLPLLFLSCSALGLEFISFSKGDPDHRTFRTPDLETGQFYDCPADILARGTYCLVYGETGSSLTVAQGEAIAQEFDRVIYPVITSGFGRESDVDGNGKIILFYLDIQDGYSNDNPSYVAGLFYYVNNYSTITFRNSNGADMIFLDTYPTRPGSLSAYETVAHEFQHLINYNVTVLEGRGPTQDTWINEGLSSGAEYVYSGEISQDRVNYYNRDSRLVSSPADSIAYGNNFFHWDFELEDYATVSLFFQWLRIHASNGTGIYREILNSDHRDYRSVTAAAGNRIDPSFGDWSPLLSTWMIANLLNLDSGFFGYSGLIDTEPRTLPSAPDASVSLAPGERIFYPIPAGGYTPPSCGGNIEYRGIGADGTIDGEAPFTGDYALVFNANPDDGGSTETGYVAGLGISEPVLSRGVPPDDSTPAAQKVDARFNADGSVQGMGEG